MEKLARLAGQVSQDPKPTMPAPPRRLQFRLTDSQREALVRDYLAGTPTTTLTTRYQLSKGSVLQVLADAEVTMRRQGLTDAQTIEAIRLYESGLSLARVADRLDSAPTTVSRALQRQGVVLRARPGRN